MPNERTCPGCHEPIVHEFSDVLRCLECGRAGCVHCFEDDYCPECSEARAAELSAHYQAEDDREDMDEEDEGEDGDEEEDE